MNSRLAHFFALSIAIHIVAFFIIKPHPMSRIGESESIAVSLLPQAADSAPASEPAPTATPKERPSRRTLKSPSIVAKKDTIRAKKEPVFGHKRPVIQKEPPAPLEEKIARVEAKPEEPPPPPPIPENTVVVERPLPTLKELLPPVTWASPSGRASGPISLDTRDPIYVSYFTKIKQTIEQQWEYPEVALRYGLQGRLLLEFTIGGNGQLENLRMIRSSGSQVLDQEALRAIQAAAPFPPIPTWIKSVPLSISASMEYHDNRLNYRFSR